jgi:DNA-directed RNA polymerase subunit RPC12/RpoP
VDKLEYLTKNDDKSLKKQLSMAMLWYDVNVLDTPLTVFNGVPAFTSTLLGSIELAKGFQDDEPVKAIIFKHPAGMENYFDYSFGIFIQAYTSMGLSDYSGWLVFFDCATDYSGFGGSLFDFEESKPWVARCSRCGRPISSEDSLRAGLGCVCRRKSLHHVQVEGLKRLKLCQ